jgi:hypothetical protein
MFRSISTCLKRFYANEKEFPRIDIPSLRLHLKQKGHRKPGRELCKKAAF